MAAVLKREEAISIQAAGPVQQLLVAWVLRFDGQLTAKLAGERGHRGGGVGLFVGVDSDYDHLVPFRIFAWQKGGPPADRPWWGLLAKLLLGHAGVPRQAAGDRTMCGQPLRRQRSIGSAHRRAEAMPEGRRHFAAIRGASMAPSPRSISLRGRLKQLFQRVTRNRGVGPNLKPCQRTFHQTLTVARSSEMLWEGFVDPEREAQ